MRGKPKGSKDVQQSMKSKDPKVSVLKYIQYSYKVTQDESA